MSDWCTKWNLSLNSNKCTSIHFHSAQSQDAVQPAYSVGECMIPFLESQCDLGVMVSGTLSWSQQCNLVCSKAYRAFHIVRRSAPTTSSLTLKKRLYLTLIRSHVSYCCQLWRPYLVKDFLAIEKIQRRATKYILGNYVDEYKTRLISLNMLPLMYWLDLQDLLFMTKCLQDPKDTI